MMACSKGGRSRLEIYLIEIETFANYFARSLRIPTSRALVICCRIIILIDFNHQEVWL